MLTILPIFILILLGVFFVNVKLAKIEWVSILNDYIVRIGFPALIIMSLSKLQWNVQLHGTLILVNTILVFSCFVAVLIVGKVFKLSAKLKRTLFIATAYGNVAYLGIPVIVGLLGAEAQPEAALITACYLFWIFSVGMVYLEYSKSGEVKIKKVVMQLLKTPLIVSVYIGMFFMFFHISLPPVIAKSFEMIALSVTPVILFSLGIFIGSSVIGNVNEWIPVILLVVIMLFVKPALLYLGLIGANLQIQSYQITILEAAMPMAVTPFALATEFDLDAKFLARGIVLSTALSMGTLYLWHNFILMQF